VVRLLPGVLGDESSAVEDSYTAGLLDCPQYTRPETVDGRTVPSVLLGGDHAEIRRWRLQQSLGRTWLKRPSLLAARGMSAEEAELLEGFKEASAGLNSGDEIA
jgi:tRNA (guanine37-N1)-methyltransferase